MAAYYLPGAPVLGSGTPSDSLFVTTPNDGQLYTDQGTGTLYERYHGAWQTVGGSTHAFQFKVSDYGAVGDGTTDDTSAINSAVTAAFGYAQSNNGYAEIIFEAKTYVVAGATTKGGATAGNAQIPIPVQATTAQKVTLVFVGVRDASALLHWQQTVGQRNGTILRTTITGANDAAWGEASVIGGPATSGSSATYGPGHSNVFNNVLVVLDGIQVQSPTADPTMCGFDFRGCAEANVVTAACHCDVSAATLNSTFGSMTHTWTFGLAMPLVNNNDNSNIGWFSCEGWTYGFMPSEHTKTMSTRCIYCVTGVECISGGGVSMPHAIALGYTSVEACSNALGAYPSGNINLVCEILDMENCGGSLVYDPNNLISGTIITKKDNSPTNVLNGGTSVRLIDPFTHRSGNVAAPSVPATTVALTNPFWRDAAVTVSGGTVTVIAVDGTTTGVTSGTVFVPSGKTITLTYSVAPTWVWTLL